MARPDAVAPVNGVAKVSVDPLGTAATRYSAPPIWIVFPGNMPDRNAVPLPDTEAEPVVALTVPAVVAQANGPIADVSKWSGINRPNATDVLLPILQPYFPLLRLSARFAPPAVLVTQSHVEVAAHPVGWSTPVKVSSRNAPAPRYK